MESLARLSDVEVSKFRVGQILLVVAPLTTLIVNPWTNYDPISLPKMLVLVTSAFTIFALLVANRVNFLSSTPRSLHMLVGSFCALMFSTLLFSGAPLTQQIWGSFGRNTGFLTYISLVVILLALVWVRNAEFYKRMSWYFVLTSLPMTAYCLVQIAGKDPIPWSEFNTFGTLGNINFLSAFLGMTSIGAFVYALDGTLKLSYRVLLCVLTICDLLIIYSTGSIQGPIIFVVGVFVYLFIQLLSLEKARATFLALFTVASMSGGFLLVLALQNMGPLAKLVYQPSVIFRGDYIHAGWEMTFQKPIFGVGMDSFGDWYREMRGEISTLRTGPDRVANTAHNIFLDISSNGGVLLGLSYLGIVLFALISGVRVLRSDSRKNSHFKVFFSVWVAYQVQALVSINQIGVGIWGWMLSGALIGMSLMLKEESQKSMTRDYRSRSRDFRGRPLRASHALIGFSGLAIGIVLAAIPVSADIRYRAASDRGDLTQMIEATSVLGSTEFHRELVLDFAMRNNYAVEVKEIADGLVSDYPRSFFGWRVLSVAAVSSEEERQKALEIARTLDPFNPDIRG